MLCCCPGLTEPEATTPGKVSTNTSALGKKDTQQDLQQLQNQISKYKDIIQQQEQLIQVR